MITPEEAEVIAGKMMQDYVTSCKCNTVHDVANALMMLVSVCSQGMCAAVGQPETVKRLEIAAAYIAKTQEGRNWSSDRAH